MENKKLLIGYNNFEGHCLADFPDFFEPARKCGGVDFITCHADQGTEPIPEQLEKAKLTAAKLKELCDDFIVNFEGSNFERDIVTADGHDWANREDGTHRVILPDGFLDAMNSEGTLAAMMYDEFEHTIINRNLSIRMAKKGDLPVFPVNGDGDLDAAAETLDAQLREYVAELKAKGAPAVVGEHVFPVLFHRFAANGIIPNFKSQKESISNVQFAIAAGAALEYGTPLFNCVDLWYRMTFPGHSPEEMYNNLKFAYYAGVNRVYVEASSGFYSKNAAGQQEFNRHGELYTQFVKEYRGKERAYDVQDYRPEIGVIRMDDSFWGQGKCFGFWRGILFGDPSLKIKKENKEFVHIMNLITHGATGNGGLALSKIEAHSLLPHISFAPMNGAAVFDEKVGKDKLESLKLCFLCGHKISEKTLDTVKELVRENGLTVVTTGRLLDAQLYAKVNSDFCEIKDGEGVWIVVNDFRSSKLKKRVRGFLGADDEIRLPFTTGTVRLKIKDKGNAIDIIE